MQHIETIPARVGSARLTCDYNAISVQLQLQLPTGTELGKNAKKMVSINSICFSYIQLIVLWIRQLFHKPELNVLWIEQSIIL